ncbi:MAG: hypothetical protein EHM23_11050 [Acidobacteria bacterium]|nr:MAG: hypothetical protein EHM23_11050 [Acidobacteriota bacterium]
MRVARSVSAVFVILVCIASAFAQSESKRGVEVFAGYTRLRSDVPCCSGNANGYHVGAGYTPISFLLLGMEFSHAFGPDPQYVRHLHFGPQFRFQVGALRPFGRVMGGYSEHRLGCVDLTGIASIRHSSVAFGGGVDLQVHRRLALRVISLDRIRIQDQWDTRASFGAVFLLY